MNEKKQKVGIIGWGKMGKLRAKIVNNSSDTELKSIFDPILLDTIPSKFKCSDYKDMYTNCDTIFVCVPHVFTCNYVIESLENNMNVFAEKPPAITSNDVKKEIKAEEKSNKKFKVGFNHRYHEAVLKSYEIIKSEKLGKINWIRGVYGRSDPGGNWRDNSKLAAHGILLSQGIHLVDIFRLYLGDFSEVKSFVSNGELENNVFAILRNKKKQTASIHSSSLMFKHTFSIDIGLEKGYISINNILTESHSFGGYETLKIGLNDSGIRGNPVEHTYVYNKDDSWQKEISSFIKNIEQDIKVEWGSSYEALKNMELVEQIYNDDKN